MENAKVMLMFGVMVGALCLLLGSLIVVGCGDSNTTNGSGGDLVCASDDPSYGNTIDCPGGAETLDFCFNTGNGDCYYVLGGNQVGCGNCIESNFNLGSCTQQAFDLCNQ